MHMIKLVYIYYYIIRFYSELFTLKNNEHWEIGGKRGKNLKLKTRVIWDEKK